MNANLLRCMGLLLARSGREEEVRRRAASWLIVEA
jgi:hypothetical protein